MLVYKITNTINGKIYIGATVKDRPGYYGGGKLIKAAITKYGKYNFTKEILCICETYKELNKAERQYIYKYKTKNRELGYNIQWGGNCNYDPKVRERKRKKVSGVNHPNYGKFGERSSAYGSKRTKEQKEEMSISRKGSKNVNYGITWDWEIIDGKRVQTNRRKKK